MTTDELMGEIKAEFAELREAMHSSLREGAMDALETAVSNSRRITRLEERLARHSAIHAACAVRIDELERRLGELEKPGARAAVIA